MAFTPTTLARMAHANGFTHWVYRTADLAADVDNVDYFLEAIRQINVGDLITVIANGGTEFAQIVCNFNDGTNIDFADINNLAAADTD